MSDANKLIVQRTHEILRNLGVSIKLGQVYELYARLSGFRNWPTAKSKGVDFKPILQKLDAVYADEPQGMSAGGVLDDTYILEKLGLSDAKGLLGYDTLQSIEEVLKRVDGFREFPNEEGYTIISNDFISVVLCAGALALEEKGFYALDIQADVILYSYEELTRGIADLQELIEEAEDCDRYIEGMPLPGIASEEFRRLEAIMENFNGIEAKLFKAVQQKLQSLYGETLSLSYALFDENCEVWDWEITQNVDGIPNGLKWLGTPVFRDSYVDVTFSQLLENGETGHESATGFKSNLSIEAQAEVYVEAVKGLLVQSSWCLYGRQGHMSGEVIDAEMAATIGLDHEGWTETEADKVRNLKVGRQVTVKGEIYHRIT